MATVKNPLMSADARGSVSSNTFSRNRSGNIVRNRTKPTNVNTPARAAVRAALAAVSQLWRGLTQAQRDGWALAAPNFPYLNKVGEVSIYSGQQLFMKMNQQLQVLGLPTIENAPTPTDFPDLVSAGDSFFTLTPSPVLSIAVVPDTVPEGLVAVVQASAPVSAGVDSPASVSFKSIVQVDEDAMISASVTAANYEGVYGTPPAGAKIWWRIKYVNATSGQSSPWVTFSLIVTNA